MVHTIVTNKNINFEKIKEATDWLGNKLMGKRLANNVGVEVVLIHNLCKKKAAHGLFYCVDTIKSRPREFEIELDSSLAESTIIQCLCHEMVHVKQTVKLEFREDTDDSKIWYGKKIDTIKTDYWELPWEIEAHGRERGLYLHLMDHFDTIGL
jgi:hypothetical protein